MAAAGGMSFREVRNHGFNQKWKEISVPTGEGGASSGYLQDHKVTDRAGGYGYKDSGRVGCPSRNRAIYWRSHQDALELIETSLDLDLKGCCVRFRFQNAAIVGDVNIHESHGNVVILVTTTTSVHRLIFPHPNRLQKYDSTYLQSSEKTVPSVFTDASVVRVQDPGNCHNFNLIGLASAYQIHTASSWLTNEGEAIFALATSVGSILIVKLPPYGIQGIATQHELKQSSMMQRLWTGFVPSVIRKGADMSEATSSLFIHPMGQDTFVFAAGRDHKIRMWSTKSYECVMAADLLEFMPSNTDPAKLTVGDEGHMIRKSVASSMQVMFLGVFMSFSDRCQFCVFQPVMAEGRYQMNHITTVFGPQDDLVDFCLMDSHLWSLWTSSHGENFCSCTSIEYNRPGIQSLQSVTMETAEPAELEVPAHLEPREYYLDQIFYPDRFSTQAIIKALNIFKRSLDSSQMPDAVIPTQALKTEVTAVVEHEIQSSASDVNISEDEYQNLQLQQWTKFYSCCVQYQERSTKAVGMFADNDTGLVAVIKRGCMSLFRPCDSVEHLSLTPLGECHVEDFEPNLILWEDEPLFRDVITLGECLKLVRQCLTDEYVYSFEQDLYHTQNPLEVADNVIQWLINDTECPDRQSNLQEISVSLRYIQDLDRAVRSLIELLDLVQKQPDDMMDDMGVDTSRQLSLGRLFASSVGLKVVCRGVQQFAQSRLDLSRDLLLLLTLVTRVPDEAGVPLPAQEQITSDLLCKACVLVRAYFVVKWASEILTSQATASQIETNVHLLESLGLLETMGSVTAPVLNDHSSSVLLELFLGAQGGQKVRDILSHDALFDEDPCSLWSKALMPVITSTAQVLWPYNSAVVFPEFLISHCQYTALQEYVRLTKEWCDINRSTHRFFSGLSYLSSGEHHKAMECFLKVPQDVASEDFLLRLVEDMPDAADFRVSYFLKVLGLFEQFQYPHLAVDIARNAISIAANDDPNVPTLWSKVFKNELEMGHNEKAYDAMLANPDKDRRRDCLRQFLVVLCERSELQTLVSLPYRDRHVILEDEVVSILESRARFIDLTKHNYYDLLYAFHIFRHNYRKAGSVMYEYGMRLGREMAGLKGLQKQAKCYLAALNALRIGNPDYAWIVKPLSSLSKEDDRDSPKRDIEGTALKFKKKSNIEVLELEDIEREYMLVHARLQLLQKSPDPSYMTGPTPSASETIGLLVNVGLFDSAINICKMFKMPLTPVFEGLASRCVSLAENSQAYMQGDNDYTSQAWDWLQHNELATANATREASSTDHAWRLLQKYLQLYEDGTTLFHKCVAVKFLSQGFSLPSWLAKSYKELNAAELLRLYLDYDLLEEASYLTLEYIDAVRGKGNEIFGLKTYLHSGAPAVWLPYTSIDQLISALDQVETEPLYLELHQKLQDKLNVYFREVKEVSDDSMKAQQMAVSFMQQTHIQTFTAMES